MTHGGRIPSAKMRPSTPRAWAQSAAPTSKSDPDDQPRKKIWKGAQKSTCKKVGSPSRPPNLAAAARRACQGWPRLRGHPGLALTGPSTAACCIGRARKGPHHNLTRYGAWPRQFPTATPASKFHRRPHKQQRSGASETARKMITKFNPIVLDENHAGGNKSRRRREPTGAAHEPVRAKTEE